MAKRKLLHPEFMRIAKIANQALVDAATSLDCEDDLIKFEAHANRVVDDMTALLLRAWKVKHS